MDTLVHSDGDARIDHEEAGTARSGARDLKTLLHQLLNVSYGNLVNKLLAMNMNDSGTLYTAISSFAPHGSFGQITCSFRLLFLKPEGIEELTSSRPYLVGRLGSNHGTGNSDWMSLEGFTWCQGTHTPAMHGENGHLLLFSVAGQWQARPPILFCRTWAGCC